MLLTWNVFMITKHCAAANINPSWYPLIFHHTIVMLSLSIKVCMSLIFLLYVLIMTMFVYYPAVAGKSSNYIRTFILFCFVFSKIISCASPQDESDFYLRRSSYWVLLSYVSFLFVGRNIYIVCRWTTINALKINHISNIPALFLPLSFF